MKSASFENFRLKKIKLTSSILLKLIATTLYLTIVYSVAFAEGSKEIYIGNNSTGLYFCNDFTTHCNNGAGERTNFAVYNCDSLERLYFDINSTDETVYVGFNGNSGFDWHIVYRIKDIIGNIVKTETALPTSGAGFINSIIEAREGPQQLVGTTGYDAIEFSPSSTGKYYIEFQRVLNSSPTTPSLGTFRLDLFDITVANTNTSTAIPGRLYTYGWQMGYYPDNADCSAKFYIYTNDSIVTSLELNDMDGRIWNLFANQTGAGTTGDFIQDRKSVNSEVTPTPQYRIFLNEPDNNIFPVATTFGSIIPPITGQTNCNDGTIDFTVEVDKAGMIEIDLFFNPPYISRSLMENVNSGVNIITWDGYDGTTPDSLPVPNNTNITYTVSYINGLTNIPMFDIESNNNGFVVEQVSPTGTTPQLYWDDSNLPGGTTNLTGCNSTTSPWSGCHSWLDGDNRTINTWYYTSSITTYPPSIVQERNPDSLIFVQQPPQYYSPGATNVPFSVVVDPNTDSYFWSYSGSDATINQVNQSDNFITIDFGTSATSGDLEVYGTNVNCPNQGPVSILPITIGPPPAVDADFSGTPTTGDAPLQVNFTDLSTGAIDSWLWGFGDGNTSTSQNPTHIYNSTGTFTVSLTITDQSGSDTETKTDYINVTAPLIIPEFEGDVTTGDAPLDITFTDLSSGNITSWLWDFGDDNTSTAQNPVHTYSNPGNYSVSLTISDPYSSQTEVKTDYITASTPIITVDFEGIPTSGEIPLEVNFTDLSTGNIISWLWDFGDGNTSTDQNPIHTYNSVGIYTVNLTVTDQFSSDSEIKADYITVTIPSLLAEFEADPTFGDFPLEVTYTDISVGNPDTWLWDFGDGNTSTDQNPVHTYMDEGVYTVSLSVSDPYSSDTEIKPDFIVVSAFIAEFEAYPTSGFAPLDVTFTDLSTGEIDTWWWDFGDGHTSSDQFPVHAYSNTGTFTVSLIITGNNGSDTIVKTDLVNTNAPAPIAYFSASPTYGEAPLLVNFTDISTGEIDSWSWDFGDGGSSLDQHPTHEYISSGNFTVSLTVEGIGGSNTLVQEDFILIPLGTNENLDEVIIVFPNPVSDKLHIVFPESGKRTFIINNLDGKTLIKTSSDKKEVNINTKPIGNGVYTVIILKGDKLTETIKIIKRK